MSGSPTDEAGHARSKAIPFIAAAPTRRGGHCEIATAREAKIALKKPAAPEPTLRHHTLKRVPPTPRLKDGRMWNLYSITKGKQAIRDLPSAMRDPRGNLPILPGVFPN